jgi:GNAT superfamily N-acetyltransferase
LIDPDLLEYAETPDRFAPIAEGSSVTRFDDGRVCVIQGPTWAGISGPRFDEGELDEVIALVHELVPADKHQVWWIGPSARPENIVELLKARGFEPAQDGPEVRAMVLTTAPPRPAEGIEVRRIETFEDFAASRQVQWEAFNMPESRREAQREHMRSDFEESIEHGVPVGFLALFDGKPGATGLAIPSDRGVFLIGGSAVPRARGRGLYRALVRARWDYAVERGTPALVTEAIVTTSYPILQRLGFTEVCTIRRLEENR